MVEQSPEGRKILLMLSKGLRSKVEVGVSDTVHQSDSDRSCCEVECVEAREGVKHGQPNDGDVGSR